MDNNKVAIFHNKEIRRTIFQNEWWFVLEDIIQVLTDSKDPKQYIKKMRSRDPELNKGWVQFVPTLTFQTKGGLQQMQCANTEGIFRIIQSIPSPKAEPIPKTREKIAK